MPQLEALDSITTLYERMEQTHAADRDRPYRITMIGIAQRQETLSPRIPSLLPVLVRHFQRDLN